LSKEFACEKLFHTNIIGLKCKKKTFLQKNKGMAEQERGLNNHSLKKIYLTGVVPEQILGKQKLRECWG